MIMIDSLLCSLRRTFSNIIISKKKYNEYDNKTKSKWRWLWKNHNEKMKIKWYNKYLSKMNFLEKVKHDFGKIKKQIRDNKNYKFGYICNISGKQKI